MNKAHAGESATSPNASMERLRWQCRRGMLELDLLFSNFLEQEYSTLSSREQQCFQRLLDQPDPLLLTWFMGQSSPEDAALARLIGRIRQRTALPHSVAGS
jgi:antitoxin CptB